MGVQESKLQVLGYPIEKIARGGDLVSPLSIDGTTTCASGQVPLDGDQLVSTGKVS